MWSKPNDDSNSGSSRGVSILVGWLNVKLKTGMGIDGVTQQLSRSIEPIESTLENNLAKMHIGVARLLTGAPFDRDRYLGYVSRKSGRSREGASLYQSPLLNPSKLQYPRPRLMS